MYLFNDQIMQAICWTLIHSLWEGLLLAVFSGLAVVATSKSSSVIRYNTLSVLFFLFIAASCITFITEYNTAASNNTTDDIKLPLHREQAGNVNIYPFPHAAVTKTYPEIFTDYFNENASLIVMIWFVVMSLQCIRFIAHAGYARRIRHYGTHAAPQYWNQRMQFLAKKLKIKQRVRLLQSEIVKVPVMTGFFKPVILFPFSLMSQLPPQQVEAVLLHELAHIRRKDYFLNLLQRLTEIIFFFNPGVLWVSSLIKDERENCCDDIAINETKRKNEFVHALVSFQEYHLLTSKTALAFPGRKNHLLNRVKRILTNNNKTLNNMEKISLAAGIVVIGLITIAFKQTIKQDAVKGRPAAKILKAKEINNDTLPNKPETTAFSFNGSIDGKKYRIKEIDGKVVELYVEGKKIPEDKIGDYQEIIDRLHEDAKKQQDELQAQNALLNKERAEMMARQNYLGKQQDEMNQLRDHSMNKGDLEKLKQDQDELMANIAMLRQEEETMAMKFQSEQQEYNLISMYNSLKAEQLETKNKIRMLEQENQKKPDESIEKQIFDLKGKHLAQQQKLLEINKMLLDHQQNTSARSMTIEHDPETITVDGPMTVTYVPNTPPAPPVDGNKEIAPIIEDLVNAGLIADQTDLSFTLNNELLKVNGKVQPEELHAKLKEKYLKGKKDFVKYSKKGGSTHTEVITHSD